MANLCLNWSTRPECSARPQQDLTHNDAAKPGVECPNINWFWYGLAAVFGIAVVKGMK